MKQFHSAEKLERGDPLGFLKLQFDAKSNTEAKQCFATHDEVRIYIILIACVYIFNSSTLFNNVLMAQWLTLMPRNREAAGSNLSGVLAFL